MFIEVDYSGSSPRRDAIVTACVRSFCAQFVDYVFDMKIDGVLGNRELIGYLFVLPTVANQLQHLELARRKILFSQVLCEQSRDRRRHLPFARMNRSDDCQQSSGGILFRT